MEQSMEARQKTRGNQAAVNLTDGSVKYGLIRFSLPILIGNLFQQMYNAVDSLIVGNFVGSTALAAVTSTGTLIYLLVGLFYGVAMGAGVVIARFIGAKDDENISRSVHTTVAFGLVVSVLLAVVGAAASPTLLHLMDTPDNVMSEATTYLTIYFAGIVGLVMYNVLVGIMQAAGDSRHPLYYLIFSSCLNIVLDLALICIFGMGVGGAALATVISQITSAILLFVRLMRLEEAYGIRIRKIRIDGGMLLDIVRVGVPSGVQNCAHALSNVVIQSYINGYGSAAMAGIGAYVKVEGFALLPLTSLSLAVSTYVSQNLGAGKKDRVDEGVRFTLTIGIIMIQLIGVILFLFSPQLIGLFSSDPEVIAYGVGRARVGTVFFFLLAYTQLMTGILRGCKHSAEPMAVFILFWCVMRTLIMAVGSQFTASVALTYWVYPITWLMSSAALFFLWRRIRKTL